MTAVWIQPFDLIQHLLDAVHISVDISMDIPPLVVENVLGFPGTHNAAL